MLLYKDGHGRLQCPYKQIHTCPNKIHVLKRITNKDTFKIVLNALKVELPQNANIFFLKFSKKTNFSLLPKSLTSDSERSSEIRIIYQSYFFRKKASTQKKKFWEIENHFLFYPVPLVKKVSKKNWDEINFYLKKTILLFLRF